MMISLIPKNLSVYFIHLLQEIQLLVVIASMNVWQTSRLHGTVFLKSDQIQEGLHDR
jgi:hypothetical protein